MDAPGFEDDLGLERWIRGSPELVATLPRTPLTKGQ